MDDDNLHSLPARIGRYEIKAELGRGGMTTVYVVCSGRALSTSGPVAGGAWLLILDDYHLAGSGATADGDGAGPQ